jgi:hypothetical protein
MDTKVELQTNGTRRFSACAADAKAEVPLYSGRRALLVLLIWRLFWPPCICMFREVGFPAEFKART